VLTAFVVKFDYCNNV